MSDPDVPHRPDDPLLTRIADQLIPLFETGTTTRLPAKADALSAIAAYHPESRADFVNIARILAFSMASLAALGYAADADLPPALKMRYFGRANALNRSADQTERGMMQRRRDQRANPPPELPAYLGPQAAPEPPQDDAPIDAAIEEALATYRALQKPPPAEKPATDIQPAELAAKPASLSSPQPAHPQPAWPQAAPRTAVSAQGQRPATLYKQSLLQRSAMVRVAAMSHPTTNLDPHRPRPTA